jgi:hypothetical protein
MNILKETQYLQFVLLDRDKDRKTDVVLINNKHHNMTIGYIKWFGRWRQYCFFPYGETTWNTDCLESINEVIKQLMNTRNKKKLEKL